MCAPLLFADPSYASPEFARSGAEWEALSDNRLAWDELAALVHEYNATVLNNRKAMQKDAGKDAREIRDTLLSAADELDALAADLESEEGGTMSGASYRAQALSLRSQADDNTADSDTIRWQYEKTEAELVRSAKELFIGYYQAQLEKEAQEAALPYLERQYRSAENRRKLGAGTELEALTAKEALQTAQAALFTTDAEISSGRRKLQVLCGWKYDAEPEIGALPEWEAESFAELSPEEDTERALSANRQLRIDERQLENAPDETLRAQYRKTVETDRQQIRAAVKSAYDTLFLSKTAYETACAELSLRQQRLEKSGRELSLGQISEMEYAAAEQEATAAEYAVKQKRLEVFSAWTAYDAAVNGGLAETGTVA